jgi:predicted enzyme related to lactoylglutathione lyase
MANLQPTIGNGKICYVEIPSSNPKAASKFYKDVFGWNIRTRGDGAISFDDGVGQVSGAWVLNRKTHSEVGVLVSIMVDDMQESIKLVMKHGGKIVQPVGMDAPEITARFTDLDGNVFGLYQEPVQKQ